MKKYKFELLLTALIVAVLLLASCEKDRCKCYKVDVEIEYYPNPHIIKADTSRALFKDCDCNGTRENVEQIWSEEYSGAKYTEYFCE